MTKVFPIILAGGAGTRLWPLSRQELPKQFLNLIGDKSLLQNTIERVACINAEKTFVITNESHYFICKDQLSGHNINYLLEPISKNTAIAIASAAFDLQKYYSDEVIMAIFPADHWIEANKDWENLLSQSIQLAEKHNLLITFGINPTSPKTGYGYIYAKDKIENNLFSIDKFHEKPSEDKALDMINTEGFYWNSGMFVSKASVYLAELKLYAPAVYKSAQLAVDNCIQQYDFTRLFEEAYRECENISIDYAVMEKTKNAALMPFNIPWSDLGSWSSVAEAQELDSEGNTTRGPVVLQDSTQCYVSSSSTLVTAVGIKDQIIIATDDAVLVADKSYAEKVKDIVATLKTKKLFDLTVAHKKTLRPWGSYEVLAEGINFKVKRLIVKPHQHLSLQKHEFRAEHWVVVAGCASIINADITAKLYTNQSTYIPPQTIHRLSNLEESDLIIIEIQSGSYLGEDDITRYDDAYMRPVKEK